MENYRRVQNLPNSPLAPLTPLGESNMVNFNFQGDGSLDEYIKDAQCNVLEVGSEIYSKKENIIKLTDVHINYKHGNHSILAKRDLKGLKSRYFKLNQPRIINVDMNAMSNKCLSPRLAKLLQHKGLTTYSKLFEREEIDIWVFSQLERKDLHYLGINDDKDKDVIMAAVQYAKDIYNSP